MSERDQDKRSVSSEQDQDNDSASSKQDQDKHPPSSGQDQDQRSASSVDGEEEAKQKAKAAAIAKKKAAAAAKKKARNGKGKADKEEKPKEPSKNQPLLDQYVKVIKENMGEDVLEDAYINELAKEAPTLVINNDYWYEAAQFLKHNEQLRFDYLSSLHGTDFETHMEIYYHFYSFKEKQSVDVKVKVDRDHPGTASVTPIWPGADWPERETYDLLGIYFEGHPNLKRILLTDDWVGHPLRKDYEQHDEEV